jgi:DNA topoisomerase I
MVQYTLIVTEKPDAANRIATALDEKGKPKKAQNKGVPFYEAYNKGNVVVVSALGHLYTINSIHKIHHSYPILDYQWVPRYQAERKASRIRVWLDVIAKLAADAERFVDACDFDIEGSIIGYSILKYACGNKEKIAKRMKYSTLTKEELQESYDNLLPTLDFALVEAGLTRHEVDWLYGINLSRALTQAAKVSSGHQVTLSTGRVQGPTLKFLESREQAIQSFVPTPYWTVTAKNEIDGFTFEVEYEKAFQTRIEATKLMDACNTKEAQIQTVDTKELKQNPPFPFDLTTLQSEAYRLFRYSPIRTSDILQHLYIMALISYPRTSSQKLPPSINYRNILNKLAKTPRYAKQTIELLNQTALKPNEGKKIDLAHPAIYPTGNLPGKNLSTAEHNMFDLVVKRFFAVFGEPANLQKVHVTVGINVNRFNFYATQTLMEGWLKFYQPYTQLKNDRLPSLIEGQKINIKRVTLNNQFAKPPPRYNPRSLLLKMDKEEIGTKATRAATIQTLHERKYLSGKDSLAVSDLGSEVVDVLSKYCPSVVSTDMTRKLEQHMDNIQKGTQTKTIVLEKTNKTLKKVTSELKENEAAIGARLNSALHIVKQNERTVGACPKCSDGQLVIMHSKKTGKRFVGCSNYFKGRCNTSYPLPQKGTVKPRVSPCKKCGSPTIVVHFPGRKTWKSCLDPQCISKTTN